MPCKWDRGRFGSNLIMKIFLRDVYLMKPISHSYILNNNETYLLKPISHTFILNNNETYLLKPISHTFNKLYYIHSSPHNNCQPPWTEMMRHKPPVTFLNCPVSIYFLPIEADDGTCRLRISCSSVAARLPRLFRRKFSIATLPSQLFSRVARSSRLRRSLNGWLATDVRGTF